MVSSGMLRRVAVLITDVSEELSASFIRLTRIGELGATLAVTSNRRTIHEPHGVTSQKTPFFIVTAVETSNLTGGIYSYRCGIKETAVERWQSKGGGGQFTQHCKK
jgi:hypothetical protein